MNNLAKKIKETPVYDFQAIINENIRILMLRFGYTQQDLSGRLGVTRASISHYLTAKREWGLNDLARVASVFGTTPWDLVKPSKDYEKSQAQDLANILELPRLDSNQRP